jgi:hypothetical protein
LGKVGGRRLITDRCALDFRAVAALVALDFLVAAAFLAAVERFAAADFLVAAAFLAAVDLVDLVLLAAGDMRYPFPCLA